MLAPRLIVACVIVLRGIGTAAAAAAEAEPSPRLLRLRLRGGHVRRGVPGLPAPSLRGLRANLAGPRVILGVVLVALLFAGIGFTLGFAGRGRGVVLAEPRHRDVRPLRRLALVKSPPPLLRRLLGDPAGRRPPIVALLLVILLGLGRRRGRGVVLAEARHRDVSLVAGLHRGVVPEGPLVSPVRLRRADQHHAPAGSKLETKIIKIQDRKTLRRAGLAERRVATSPGRARDGSARQCHQRRGDAGHGVSRRPICAPWTGGGGLEADFGMRIWRANFSTQKRPV